MPGSKKLQFGGSQQKESPNFVRISKNNSPSHGAGVQNFDLNLNSDSTPFVTQ